jgi:sec-independent protein translocase protein TatA
MMYFAFGMPGPVEWVVILVIVLIIFGIGKLPKVLGQMGKGVKAFKDGMQGEGDGEIDITPDSDLKAIESREVEEAREVGTPSTDLHDAVTQPGSDEIGDFGDKKREAE